MYKILIAEDEENIVSFIKAELEYEGFATEWASDGEAALCMFAENSYDLVLLDIMLPGKNGLECLREIRKAGNLPVIILTARKDVYDKVAFLSSGADDYITKPFDTLELIARIKRNIERYAERFGNSMAGKPEAGILINPAGYLAYINGRELGLTKTEFEIIRFLFENRNRVLTRDEIIAAVFGDFYGESNIVDANIKNIRAKLSKHSDEQIISTVRGKGYVIRI
jgi:DNA-binding response OmpR family regulator